MNKTLLLLLLIITNHPSFAQNFTDTSITQKLDSYLLSAQAANRFNGTALIIQKDTVLLKKGYGFKNVTAHSFNDSATIFQVGSLTKSFTAVAILKLQEEGKLSVLDKLNRFLPNFPNGDKITVQNLLTHTSGIYNYTNDIDENDTGIICHPVSKETVLSVFQNKKLQFTPGTNFEYNNSDYFLLGMIIEKVTGQPYETIVRNTILNPLHMDHSGFDFKNLKDSNKAQGYVFINKDSAKVNYTVDSTVYYAAGALYSTVTDLLKWAKAIGKHEIINEALWQQAFTPFKTDYGYGFFVDSLYSKFYVRHSGGLIGFMSDFLYYPKEDVSIILLNNVGDYGNSLFPIAIGVSAIMFHQTYSNWQIVKDSAKEDTSITKKYAGIYEYNKDHKMNVTFQEGKLYIEASNPKDQLPRVQLHSINQHLFYMKEAQLKFEFLMDDNNEPVKLSTYINKGKTDEWKKIK